MYFVKNTTKKKNNLCNYNKNWKLYWIQQYPMNENL